MLVNGKTRGKNNCCKCLFVCRCGHCKRMQPLWDSYAEENFKSRRLKVAKVNKLYINNFSKSEFPLGDFNKGSLQLI